MIESAFYHFVDISEFVDAGNGMFTMKMRLVENRKVLVDLVY